MFKEAIPLLQKAQLDPRRKGEVLLNLGECFQQIKQIKLAMSNYEAAIEAILPADEDRKKLSLYRAGVLAMGLKDWPKAEKHLSELAGLDFAYKDVSDRLDKLEKLKEDGEEGPATL
jgi:tetratricopeptide (TPR) repeat protein